MENLIIVIAVLCGILNFALFVKIWGACDNIKRLADKYAPKEKNETLETKEDIEKWLNEK